jgi:hypothetical protein
MAKAKAKQPEIEVTPPLPPRPSNTNSRLRRSADLFRADIEKALADGAKLNKMVLRLTLSDASEIKRDRTLKTEDISFKDGVMRFLGVKVEQGGVTTSRLDPDGSSPPA